MKKLLRILKVDLIVAIEEKKKKSIVWFLESLEELLNEGL